MATSTDVPVSLESVNGIVSAANDSFKYVSKKLVEMDKNILNDMRHLYDHQETIADQIALLITKVDALQPKKSFRIKPLYVGIAVVGVAYALHKTAPKPNPREEYKRG